MIHAPVIFASLVAAAIPIAIPLFQFGIIFRLWDRYNQPVNKDLCICSCWDTVFKGNVGIEFLNNLIRCIDLLLHFQRIVLTYTVNLFQGAMKQDTRSISISTSTAIVTRL